MRRELQRIEPWSAVRVGFFLGIPAGFLFGLLEAAFLKTMTGQGATLPPEANALGDLSGGSVFMMALMMSVMCSLLFALTGGIGAMIYNLIARLFGGVEVRISGDDERAAARVEHEDDENV
jgi:hypothetical protein